MKSFKLGSGFTVFILFFGIAVLEAFRTQNWIAAAFWVFIGGVFIMADNIKKA